MFWSCTVPVALLFLVLAPSPFGRWEHHRSTYELEGQPSDLQTADLNGDGALDVVVTLDCGRLVTFLGNDNGRLREHQSIPFEKHLIGVQLRDVTEDAIPDAIVLRQWEEERWEVERDVLVLAGDGHGGFTPDAVLPLDVKPSSLAVVDVDSDGDTDILVGSGSAKFLTMFTRLPDGEWLVSRQIDVGYRVQSLAVSDVNNDSRPDIIVGSYNLPYEGEGVQTRVDVLIQTRDGEFVRQDIAPIIRGALLAGFSAIETADLDSDGHLEIIASSFPVGGTFILAVGDDGVFASATEIPAASVFTNIRAGDLDADGNLDIVGTTGEVGGGRIRWGTGSLTYAGFNKESFEAGLIELVDVGDIAEAVVLDDLDGDGRLDIIAVSTEPNRLTCLLGK